MGITWGWSPAAAPGQRGRAGRPSQRGWQEGRLRAALRVSKAGNAASPRAAEDKASDSQPLRPRPRGPLRSVTRTTRAGSGFHWWARRPPGSAHRHGGPAPPRARGYEPPAGPEAVRGKLGSCGSRHPRRLLAFHPCPSDPKCGRQGTETTSCESETAPRRLSAGLESRCLFWRRAEAASKTGDPCSWN